MKLAEQENSQLSASWVQKVKRNKSSLRKLNVQIPSLLIQLYLV